MCEYKKQKHYFKLFDPLISNSLENDFLTEYNFPCHILRFHKFVNKLNTLLNETKNENERNLHTYEDRHIFRQFPDNNRLVLSSDDSEREDAMNFRIHEASLDDILELCNGVVIKGSCLFHENKLCNVNNAEPEPLLYCCSAESLPNNQTEINGNSNFNKDMKITNCAKQKYNFPYSNGNFIINSGILQGSNGIAVENEVNLLKIVHRCVAEDCESNDFNCPHQIKQYDVNDMIIFDNYTSSLYRFNKTTEHQTNDSYCNTLLNNNDHCELFRNDLHKHCENDKDKYTSFNHATREKSEFTFHPCSDENKQTYLFSDNSLEDSECNKLKVSEQIVITEDSTVENSHDIDSNAKHINVNPNRQNYLLESINETFNKLCKGLVRREDICNSCREEIDFSYGFTNIFQEAHRRPLYDSSNPVKKRQKAAVSRFGMVDSDMSAKLNRVPELFQQQFEASNKNIYVSNGNVIQDYSTDNVIGQRDNCLRELKETIRKNLIQFKLPEQKLEIYEANGENEYPCSNVQLYENKTTKNQHIFKKNISIYAMNKLNLNLSENDTDKLDGFPDRGYQRSIKERGILNENFNTKFNNVKINKSSHSLIRLNGDDLSERSSKLIRCQSKTFPKVLNLDKSSKNITDEYNERISQETIKMNVSLNHQINNHCDNIDDCGDRYKTNKLIRATVSENNVYKYTDKSKIKHPIEDVKYLINSSQSQVHAQMNTDDISRQHYYSEYSLIPKFSSSKSNRIVHENGESAILFNRCGFPLTDLKGRKLKNNLGTELLPINNMNELLTSQLQVCDCFNRSVKEKDFCPIKGVHLQQTEIQILGENNRPGRLYNSLGYPLNDEDGVLLYDSQGNLLVILDSTGTPICCSNCESIFVEDGTLWLAVRDSYNVIHYGRKSLIMSSYEPKQSAQDAASSVSNDCFGTKQKYNKISEFNNSFTSLNVNGTNFLKNVPNNCLIKNIENNIEINNFLSLNEEFEANEESYLKKSYDIDIPIGKNKKTNFSLTENDISKCLNTSNVYNYLRQTVSSATLDIAEVSKYCLLKDDEINLKCNTNLNYTYIPYRNENESLTSETITNNKLSFWPIKEQNKNALSNLKKSYPIEINKSVVNNNYLIENIYDVPSEFYY